MRQLLIATPSYDSRVSCQFVSSLLHTIMLFADRGIHVLPFFFGGSSLLPVARSEILSTFLYRTDATHLLMVDSDLAWQADDLLRMLGYSQPMLFAIAPRRMGDTFALRHLEGVTNENAKPNAQGLLEVEGAGGFGLFTRECIEQMRDGNPELTYQRPVVDADSVPFHALYDMELGDGYRTDGTQARLWFGEDYAFCRRWRAIGGHVLVDPRTALVHWHGNFNVGGRLADVLPAWR